MAELKRPVFVQEDVVQGYVCELCGRTLLDSLTVPCGKRGCKKCVEASFGSRVTVDHCPFDHSDEGVEERLALPCLGGFAKIDVYVDEVTRNHMANFSVFCPYKIFGCETLIAWKNLQEHQAECNYTPVMCPNAAKGCEEQIPENKVEDHVSVCGLTDVPCVFCHDVYVSQKEKVHLEECTQAPTSCDKCNKQCFTRCQLDVHKRLRCFDGKRPCYYCDGPALSQQEMTIHHEEFLQLHIELVTVRLVHLRKDIEKSSIEMVEESTLLQRNKTKYCDLKTFTSEIYSSLLGMRGAMHNDPDLKTTFVPLEEHYSSLRDQLDAKKELLEAVDDFVGEDMTNLKEELDYFLDVLDNTMPAVIPGIENTGMLCWRIPNAANKMNLQLGQSDYIEFGHPFFSHIGGYKMFGGVIFDAPREDSDGEPKVRVFIFLAKGDCDDALEWPFDLPVNVYVKGLDGVPLLRVTYQPSSKDLGYWRKPDTENDWAIEELATINQVRSNYIIEDSLNIMIGIDKTIISDWA